ncbi:MAG: DUF1549 and DUF1553 domain-containing protein, partial [Myxococcota bacterium]
MADLPVILIASIALLGAPDESREPGASSRSEPSAAESHWAFRAPERYSLADVENAAWPRRPADTFILSRLEAAGLAPNEPADRRTLLRRLSFDLLGLPPTPEQVEDFLADASANAYEKLVDRLLASPHYGERWARPWLDLARYAEDQAHIVGNNKALFYPNAYLYREWVVEALNSDLRYDRFIELQLAADVLAPEAGEDHVALGFLGLGPKYYDRGKLAVQADEWEDRVDTVMRGLQALTVACARCHDHKYDPISTEDYYALAGVFASTEMVNKPLGPGKKDEKGDGKGGKKRGKAKDAQQAIHIVREGKVQDLNVFERGQVDAKGPLVRRRFLRVLSSGEPQPFENGSGRADLAAAIVDRGNPLTARVIVNRIWALHFGQGLVSTPSNFGILGDKPSHPKLLDDLAVRFMDAGWSIKWLQQEIVLSAAYCQSSDIVQRKQAKDPANRLLWRMSRRRLDVESWRDALLVFSGRLDLGLGGKSFDVVDADSRRRTLYGRISRFQLDQTLALFDFPDPNVHAEKRTKTTTPIQKLFALNSPFMVRQAEGLAKRLLSSGEGTADSSRIELAYRLVYAR